jgi:hypothetical protein
VTLDRTMTGCGIQCCHGTPGRPQGRTPSPLSPRIAILMDRSLAPPPHAFPCHQMTEKERENLEAAKAEAQGLLDREREIRRNKNALYQLSVMEARHNVSVVEKKHQGLDEKLQYERVSHGGRSGGGCTGGGGAAGSG